MNTPTRSTLGKIVFRLVVLVGATMFLGVGIGAVSDLRNVSVANKKTEYTSITQIVSARVNFYLSYVKQDVRILSDLTALNTYLNSELGSEKNKLALEQMTSAFVNYSEKKGDYYKIRYIDENGQEIARVDRVNDQSMAVEQNKLWNNKGSYYFSDAMNTDSGDIYVSPLDLNTEGGEIENRGTAENPDYVPVLRMAMKVNSADGTNKGIVIVNIYADKILKLLDLTDYNTDGKLLLLDDDGHYLYDQDRNGANLSAESPQLWAGIQASSDEGRINYDHDGDKVGIFHKVYPQDNEYYWTLLILLDTNNVNYLSQVNSYNTLYGLIISLAMVVFAGYYASSRIASSTQKLLAEQEKFKLAVDGTYDHVVITDPEGIVMYANKSVERITGFSVNEIIGKKAGTKELWGGLMPVETYQAMWKTIKIDKKPYIFEVNNRRKNGEGYVAQATITPVLDARGDVQFFVSVERDITHEKEIDKVKTEFVSLASHQLRTPLTAISWYSEMLLDGNSGQLSDSQKDFVQEIYQGNRRMINLVNSLLNVSRLDLGTFAVEPTQVNVKDLVETELKECKSKIDTAHHTVTTDISPDLPVILADVNLLTMVVQNLISNAVKYTPANGKIHITLKKMTANDTVAGHHVNEDSILYSVTDNGFGIPNNQQESIFSKLFRADNVVEKDVEGTGLGLYIVKEIIELAEGQIWFKSSEGKGTTFYVLLPIKGMKSKTGTKKLS